MWIGLTAAEQSFWSDTAALARELVGPHIEAWDRKANFPRSVWRALGKRDLLGIAFQRQGVDGAADLRRLALALDAFAYGSKDLGIVNSWGVHSAMAGVAIDRWTQDPLRGRLVGALAAGERIAAFALSEPDAGSNISAMRTTARADGKAFVLNGRKTFVTNGPQADVFVVIARDADDSEGAWSAFIVERGNPGMIASAAVEKSCIRTSPCGDLELRDCRVTIDCLLGPRGMAMQSIVFPALDNDRCVVWAGRLGRLRSILEDATAYASTRIQFGRPIAEHQAILFKIAEIKAQLETSETLLSAALSLLTEAKSAHQAAAVARYVLGAATRDAADKAMQIFGGYAFYPRNHVERYQRDARLDGIGGGSDEMQRMIIGREVVASVDPRRPWMSSTIVPAACASSPRPDSGSAPATEDRRQRRTSGKRRERATSALSVDRS